MNDLNLKTRICFFAFCLLFCFVFPTQVLCQTQSFSLIISGGFLSKMTFGSLNPLPNTADVPEVNVFLENKGASFGLALGYFITDRIELQGSVNYSRSEIMNDVGNGLAGIPLGKTIVSDTKSFYYCGNVIIYFSSKRVSPYLIMGLGAVTLMPSKLRSRTSFYLNFGTGIRFRLFPHLSTSLDIKDNISFYNYPEDFEVFFPAIYSLEFKKSQHRVGLHASLSYSF